ncbi:spcs-1 [Pristionchus pacificus]|uniref:Signal peptidase complex subunit 1 n=1 Tax=Pristionchus pacificus TaxID=54126 RepID=A0A2A6BKF0_PRIPA|nr:spcs-1 [Pristionchus pacificus]|eukprot:PDM66394.1 hypothetical protein PRIPAC_47811 [Pristionchus pacificus]
MDGIIMMLPAPLQKLSTHHDYPGQRRAERIYQVILVVSGLIGFAVGFQTQQLSHAIFIWQPVQEIKEGGAASEEKKEEPKKKEEKKDEKKEKKPEKKKAKKAE